jgi:acetyltransferase-like isoleucine patch superfamily enzyme
MPALDKDLVFVHPRALVECDKIGPRTRIWAFAHVMAGAQIGSDCNLGDHVFVESGVTLGNNVTVKNGVSLWNGIAIEDNAFIGPNCVFTNDPNPRAFIKKSREKLLRTLVREGDDRRQRHSAVRNNCWSIRVRWRWSCGLASSSRFWVVRE